MKSVTVRPAEPQDAAIYADWLAASSDINLVDKAVYTYPTCNTVVVENAGSPDLLTSFHAVLVIEALAPRPGITPRQEARALSAMFDKVKDVAHAAGVREIVFGCVDPRLEKFIAKRGFQKISFPMFRHKLSA